MDHQVQDKGVFKDAWCAISQNVLGMLGYMDDPLNETLKNCDWDVEGDSMYVKIKPGCKVSPGDDLFIQYGEHYWCSIQYPFEVL